MTTSDAFAFLPGAEDLARMFRGWPVDMRLALCLEAGGACSALLYRAEESDRILPRIAAALGSAPAETVVVPELSGARTRPLRFSEEQRLLALLALTAEERGPEQLLEAAEDYSLNFRFALEEGLDPTRFVAPRPAHPSPAPQALAPNASPNAAKPPFAHRFSAQSFATEAAPAGYRALAPEERARARALDCEIRLEPRGLVVIETEPGTPEDSRRAPRAQTVYLRDDLGAFALRLPEVETPAGDLPERFTVEAAALTEALTTPLEAGPLRARVTVIGDHVHVLPGAPVPRAEAPEPAAGSLIGPVAPRGRGLARVVRGGFAAMGLSAMLAVALQAATTTREAPTEIQRQLSDLRAQIFR
ncbi:hypothetical protein V8J36_19640 [Frigidibacter sp. MR17.14]|uniref:hypothetical protein n=1 Tax=Frigidibacter sp. MR17.14 TaxID=3126509 RepID=UPI003012CA99